MTIVSWVDPITNKPLEKLENKLSSLNYVYSIIYGIPKFVKENS